MVFTFFAQEIELRNLILIVQKPAYPIEDRLAFVCIVNVGSVDC